MKKILLILLCVAASSFLHADLLQDILTNQYKPLSLSESEQDSILGNGEWRTVNGERVNRYRLEATNQQQLFRHSFYADYIIVDTQKNTRKPLSDAPVRDAVISPNGRYIAFVKADNNIYLHKLDFGTEVAVTSSKPEEHIFNGISDWLYEEEFGKTCLMAFSPDSKQLAFIRLDDAGVPATSWQMMLGEGHPETVTQSYPRSGEQNARASVCIYTISNKDIQQASLPEDDDRYIPRITWRELPPQKKDQAPTEQLVILTLNRDQNKMEVFACNPASLVCTGLYEESSSEYYVDYSLFDEWQWLSDGRFIVLTEREGWKDVFMHAPNGQQTGVMIKGNKDVTAVYGFDEALQTLYVQIAQQPQERICYALNMKKGEHAVVGESSGWNSMRLADDRKQAILVHQSDQQPPVYALWNAKSGKAQILIDNASIKQQWSALNLPAKQFTTIPISSPFDGEINLQACIFYPRQFDASKQYPVVMLQYSGVASQRVTDTWRRRWDYALADLGYVVVIADPRGTDGQGRAYRNFAYMQMGREADDQLAVAKWIADQPWADQHRIYMAGWSYGGYEVLRCMCTQPLQADGTPLIAKGIAIAPVTDWRLYDSGYTERYMRRPQVNDDGYNNADVTHLAADLKGELLIVHGNADDNVHVQNTWRMIEALINADKHYQMLIYPDDNHFLKKGKHYEHLHKQLLRFLEK